MSLNVILGENWLSLVVFWVPDAGTQSAPKSTRIKKTNNYQTTRTKPGAVNRGQARTSRTHKDLTDPQDSPWLVSAPTSCLWEKLWNLQLASGWVWVSGDQNLDQFSPNKVGSGPRFRVILPNLTCFPSLCSACLLFLQRLNSLQVLAGEAPPPCVWGILGNGVPIKHRSLSSPGNCPGVNEQTSSLLCF